MVTGPKPPGQDGLSGELTRLDKKIDEGIRGIRTTHIPDHTYASYSDVEYLKKAQVCHVDLQYNFFVPAGATIYPETSWWPNAYVDTMGCYRYAKPGTWWQLPWTGHYSIRLNSRWAANISYDPNVPNWVSALILVNQYDPGNFAVGENSTWLLSPASGTYFDTWCDHMHFAAGDNILIGFYALYDATVLSRGSTSVYTSVTIRYLGEMS